MVFLLRFIIICLTFSSSDEAPLSSPVVGLVIPSDIVESELIDIIECSSSGNFDDVYGMVDGDEDCTTAEMSGKDWRMRSVLVGCVAIA